MRPKTRQSAKREIEHILPMFLQPSTTTDSALKLLDLKSDSMRRTHDLSFLRSSPKSKAKQDETISTFIDLQSVKLKLDRGNSEIKSIGKDSWLDLMNNCTPGLVSKLRGNSSIKRSTHAIADKKDRQITNFDDLPPIKVEYVPDQDYQSHLGKRQRGRPRKESSERIALEKEQKCNAKKGKITEGYVHILQDPLGFQSDAEDIELDLEENDLSADSIKLSFGCGQTVLQNRLANREKQPYCLDFQTLIRTINSAKDKDSARKFVCRFCGKAFDKPSALGGHTAKTHYGLSLKYKHRITAQNSRKAERSRLQYLKAAIPETLDDTKAK